MQVPSMIAGIKRRTPWGMILGVLVTAGLAAGFATMAHGEEQASSVVKAPAAIAVRSATVAAGPVEASLAYTGDVKAVAQVTVLPKGSGRIEKLSVDVGSRVKKGDVIAELEAASLKAQVGQAQAALASAEARYADMLAGSREEQITQAQANLDSARARVSGMLGGRQEQITQAQAALEIAWANREKVKKGATEADLQSAQTAVDSARANLTTATARLETLRQWPTQSEWGQALGAVDSARANLAAAESRLRDAKAGPKEDVLKAAEAAVVAAKAQVAAVDDLRDLFDDRDSSMTAAAAAAAAGATSNERVNRQAAAAQAQMEAAQAKLDMLRKWPQPVDLEQLQSAVDAAKAGVMAAEFRVDQMKRGAPREDLQQAEAGVAAARAAVTGTEARLKQVKEGATEEDLWQVDSAVRQAEQAVAMAQKPFRDEDVAQARMAVVAAEQQVALVKNPYTQHSMAMVKAGVDQARAALELAQIALGESQVVSPVDGVVAERFLSVGTLVGPQNPIVSVISSEVEMVLGVEESQVGMVREGQKAEIAVAAYPGVAFPAKVSLIAPSADPKSRTFQVKVRPEANDGKLKQGMFAQVKIVTQEKASAVLVPKDAVVNRAGESAVFVLKEDTAEMRPVKLGLRHNGTIEVVSGLRLGEEIVVAGQGELRDGDKVRRS